MWMAKDASGRPATGCRRRGAPIRSKGRHAVLALPGCQSAAINVSGRSVRQVANASRRRDVSVPNRTLRAVGQERLSLVSGSCRVPCQNGVSPGGGQFSPSLGLPNRTTRSACWQIGRRLNVRKIFWGKTNKVRPLTWLDTSIGGIVSRKISLVFPSFTKPGQKNNLLIHRLQRICPHLDRKAGHGNGYPGRKAKQ